VHRRVQSPQHQEEGNQPEIGKSSVSDTTKWWSWDGDNFYFLGSHETFDEANDVDEERMLKGGLSTNWIFSQESLIDMIDKAVEMINGLPRH
jgi:hypothetical protein